MDISSITQLLNMDGLAAIAKSVGITPAQVLTFASAALPALLKQLQANAADAKKSASLKKAIQDHAGDDTSNIAKFLKEIDLKDGVKMLGHIFGSTQGTTQNNLAALSGLSGSQAETMLASLAPLVMGMLGSGSSSDSDLQSILGKLFGTTTTAKKTAATKLKASSKTAAAKKTSGATPKKTTVTSAKRNTTTTPKTSAASKSATKKTSSTPPAKTSAAASKKTASAAKSTPSKTAAAKTTAARKSSADAARTTTAKKTASSTAVKPAAKKSSVKK